MQVFNDDETERNEMMRDMQAISGSPGAAAVGSVNPQRGKPQFGSAPTDEVAA